MISDLVIRLILVLETIFLPLVMQPHVETDFELSQAISYLEHEFNDDVGLIRESPEPAHNKDCPGFPRYWLATDNLVAQYALKAAGVDSLASILGETLQQYPDHAIHGIVEVLNDEDITIPPEVPLQRTVEVVGDAKICHEQRQGNVMNDWETYADLLLYGSLDAYHSGDECGADMYYNLAMGLFDGKGFRDQAFCADVDNEEGVGPRFTTYKLALALYTAYVIGQPERQDVLSALLAQQDSSGGFYTLYLEDGESWGSVSTEPTAHAILALNARGQTNQSRSTLTTAGQCTNSNPLPDHLHETAQ